MLSEFAQSAVGEICAFSHIRKTAQHNLILHKSKNSTDYDSVYIEVDNDTYLQRG